MDNKKKIIIADDEELIRNLISDYLTNEGYEPLQASDGVEALSLFSSNPDTALIILDIMMPNLDGWETCRTIRKSSSVPIIFLSARGQEFDELTGFEAGADDYVVKPCSPAVLMKRIASLLKRSKFMNDECAFSLDGLVINEYSHEIKIDNKNYSLTLKEYNILLMLMSGHGRVFSRDQILDEIWGYDFDGDIRTIDSHVARLRTKLGDWGTKHIKTIYGTGYKIEE